MILGGIKLYILSILNTWNQKRKLVSIAGGDDAVQYCT